MSSRRHFLSSAASTAVLALAGTSRAQEAKPARKLRKAIMGGTLAIKGSLVEKYKAAREAGYTEREVVDTLRWVLRDDHKDALFWRQQLKTPAVLRKTRNGVTKFTQIFDQREAALRTAPKAPVKTQAQIDMDAAWAHIQKHGGIVYTS